jgi:hypothetical protein
MHFAHAVDRPKPQILPLLEPSVDVTIFAYGDILGTNAELQGGDGET